MIEKFVFLLVIFILFLIASFPVLLALKVANNFVPDDYKYRYNLFGFISVLLSFATGYLLNIELEGGILSGVVFVFFVSIFWGLTLVLSWSIYKKVAISAANT